MNKKGILTDIELQLINYLRKNKELKISIKDLTATIEMLERENWKLRSERSSVSHFLHEDILQLLVAAKNYYSSSNTTSKENNELEKKAITILSTTIEKLKNIHQRISIPPFKLIGFTGAAIDHIKKLKTAGTVNILIDRLDDNLNSLPELQQYSLYIIVEELLKNITTHSYAETAHIFAQIQNMKIQLAVWDNGVGFYNSKKNWRDGLHKIKQVTHELNGKMLLESAPGLGCQFKAVMPVQQEKIIIADFNHR